jgi:hypothetical protein
MEQSSYDKLEVNSQLGAKSFEAGADASVTFLTQMLLCCCMFQSQ